jgi:hypothetical protein
MTTFEPFDVVEVPIPFSDKGATKLRLALVPHQQNFSGKIVVP